MCYDFETLDTGTATAGVDYGERPTVLNWIEARATEEISFVRIYDDSVNDSNETVKVQISNARLCTDGSKTVNIGRAEATGTIWNSDPIPQAWLARFGRTVADQMLGAVESRMTAARTPGVEASLAGQSIGAGGTAAEDLEAREAEAKLGALAGWLRGEDEEERAALTSHAVMERDLLLGSSFSFTGGTEREGTYALWGRGAVTRFDGREGGLSLDGEVTSGMLGADWSRDALTAGLVVSHSLGDGSYRGESDGGAVSSSLTGLYPWGRYALSERLSLWGVAGYGEGTLELTQAGMAPIRADLDLMMAAAGLRGVLVQAPAAGGLGLAVKTDAMGVRTSTAKAQGLAAERAEATRLRLGLEGSRPYSFEGGASLTPSVEIGVRQDGGDAETGFGVDIGGGLAWADPQRGLSAELRGRSLLSHAADGFRERGFSGSLAWDPTPETARGPTLTLSQTVGAQAAGGMDALLERGTLAGLAADDGGQSELAQRRFDVTLGYGLSALGERFVSTPELGFGMSNGHRDYSLGWRLNLAEHGASALELALEAMRREAVNDNGSGSGAEPEHTAGFRIKARW